MNKSTRNLFIVIAVLCVGLMAIRKPILQGRMLPSLRALIMFVAPPKDLYVPVLKLPIDVSVAGGTVDAVFTNKYAGRHALGVFAENMGKDSPVLSEQFQLRVEMFDDTSRVVSEITEARRFLFWGPQGDGMAFLTFDAPAPLPVGKPIRCHVEVLSADPAFQKQHGPLTVYVQKDAEF
ncbi:MAG TPA: hypothetical protein VIH35_04705 [Kiritimatiellia bacterium]|jgi:hypothetical protein